MNNIKKRPSATFKGSNAQKPKNFLSSLKNILKYLKKYSFILIIALVLAAASSILSIIGPNKLSDLTDELSKSLVLDQDKLNKVSSDISSTLNEENISALNKEILTFNLNDDVIKNIVTSTEITTNDKIAFNTFLNSISIGDEKNILKTMNSLPKSITDIIITESKINDIIITKEDKLKYINIIIQNTSPNSIMKLIDKMPESIIYILLPDSKIDNKIITTKEKVLFLSSMSDIDEISSVNQIYKAVDKTPENIRNIIKPKLNTDKIKSIVIFMIILYLTSALFNFVQSFLMAIMSNKFAMELREKISNKINLLELKYFDTHSKGDLLSRITNDVDTTSGNLSSTLSSLVSSITLFIGSLIMMFKTNWIMAITAISSSLIGFSFMSIILGKSQKYFIRRQEELGKLNGHIEQIYSNHNVVKAYNGKYDSSKSFDELNESVFECNKMSQFLSGLMPSMMHFIGNLGYVLVCVVGAMLVIDNKISFGVIVAFMIYVRLFTSPLSQIAQGMSSIQSTLAASERVFEFLSEEEMESEASCNKKLNKNKVEGNIEFKNVKFGYSKEKMIIKDFSCKVKKGQKIAIVGPTGAGKTTLVNLLMKFYNIDDGDILIDGVSIKELKRENIHDLFVMVLQDTWLFDGTIRDNVKFNKKNVSDKKIIEALKTVGTYHFVKSLPNGLDYVIKDNESVSQGQKQLLTIARGMVKDAPFLILDEATSSVDTRTEELVQKAMDKLTKGKTSFIIAHRLSTIKNADLILVMKEGNIVEQGNHKTLMSKNGFYAELYNSQFKN